VIGYNNLKKEQKMQRSETIVGFRLIKHNSKIEMDMFDSQNMSQIKKAISSRYGDFIRDLGKDSIPNFDILCYLNVNLIHKNENKNLVECEVETSNVFIYDILNFSNSEVSGTYSERKDMVEVFYDRYLKDLDYIEFSQSEDFNKTLIEKFEKNDEYNFDLDKIENVSEQKFNFDTYMQCLNFIKYNNLDFSKANYYYEVILENLNQQQKQSSGHYGYGTNSYTIKKSWFVNLMNEIIDLGINGELNETNKDKVFDFFWYNYIAQTSNAPNNVDSAIQKLVWLFDWEEWEDKIIKYDIMNYIKKETDTKQLGGGVFKLYSDPLSVLFYSFALRSDISEKMSLRLLDLMPEVLKQNQKYEKDSDYIDLIKKKIDGKSEISIKNLYKILGYLFNNVQGVDIINKIVSQYGSNFGYAFANFYNSCNGSFFNNTDNLSNPFNGFGDQANYSSSLPWSMWENFLKDNCSKLDLVFYTSLLLYYIDSRELSQNSYNKGIFADYINSSVYIDIIENGYEAYKEESSEIFNLLISLMKKFPDRNKREKYSRRDKAEIMERFAKKEFIVDNSAFDLLSYMIEEAEKDNDFDEVPYILLKNEKFVNNKKAFMKLWDVFGSKHIFREEVASMDKMPKEVYDNLARSKSDTVQNRLKPKNEITFIK
jgi:hypothetical protein